MQLEERSARLEEMQQGLEKVFEDAWRELLRLTGSEGYAAMLESSIVKALFG